MIKAFSNNYIEYESEGNKNKMLSIEEYLIKIRTYMSTMINYLKTQDEWKSQLTIVMNFLPSKDNYETRTMHSNSDKKTL